MPLTTVLLRNQSREAEAEEAGFAMSRGPTGSRWGPDALGPDGGLPNMPTPTYGTTSGTSFTPFAQAADFYWFWGVNHHGDASTTHATDIDRLQELGVCHVRGSIALMPNTYHGLAQQQRSQLWYIACMNANGARSLTSGGPAGTGEQPIWNIFGGPNERGYFRSPEYLAATNTTDVYKHEYWVNQQDTQGYSIWRPMDGPAGQIPTSDPNSFGGYFYTRDGTLTGTSGMGWDGVSLITGPNEPGHRFGGGAASTRMSLAYFGIRWLAREMKAYRDAPANRDRPVFSDEQYIDYNTGRITPGPAKLKQIPLIAVCHMTPEELWDNTNTWRPTDDPTGDWTNRVDSDFMSWHQYWYGHSQIWDHAWGCPSNAYPGAVGTGGQYGYPPNYGLDRSSQGHRPAINGELNSETPGVKFQRSVPMLVTEGGDVDEIGSSGNGVFFTPHDIQGEYRLKQGIVHYCQGVKRYYIYSFKDEGRFYGLVFDNHTRKASFYALKNLLALVGMRQGPNEGMQPIAIPHTYTPAGPQTISGFPSFPGQWNNRKAPNTGSQFQRDMCIKLVLRAGTNEFLILLTRLYQLWGRDDFAALGYPTDIATYNQARRAAPGDGAVSNAVLHLPNTHTWTCHVAEPAKSALTPSSTTSASHGGLTSIDGCTYANMNDGQTYAAVDDGTQMEITQSGTQLTVPMGGLTRVIRAVRS
jgi:hypothetical protein